MDWRPFIISKEKYILRCECLTGSYTEVTVVRGYTRLREGV